jgi:hypothetical protein
MDPNLSSGFQFNIANGSNDPGFIQQFIEGFHGS